MCSCPGGNVTGAAVDGLMEEYIGGLMRKVSILSYTMLPI
jgi:hypothetical protein